MKKKILMLCDFYNESLDYQENILCKYYKKHGHDVTVVTSTIKDVFEYTADRVRGYPDREEYTHGGVRIIRLPYRFNIMNRLRYFSGFAEVIESERPDLIFVHDIMLNIGDVVEYKKRNSGSVIVMDYHADYSNSGNGFLSRRVLHGVIRKWFLHRARPHISRIFPVVPAGMTFLNEIYKVGFDEMELLPLGADLDLGREISASKAGLNVRRTIGVPDDAKVVITGGKLEPKKRTEMVLEAVKGLSGYPLHVIILGEAGPGNEDYKANLVRLANDMPNVHFAGWLDRLDVFRHLDAADLAVFPASQSVLWQQAIGMGLPLVVGDTGNQDVSYLNSENNIIILKGGDIEVSKLAEAIKSLLDDPNRLSAMRHGAHRVAEEYLNWDRMIEKMLRYNRASA